MPEENSGGWWLTPERQLLRAGALEHVAQAGLQFLQDVLQLAQRHALLGVFEAVERGGGDPKLLGEDGKAGSTPLLAQEPAELLVEAFCHETQFLPSSVPYVECLQLTWPEVVVRIQASASREYHQPKFDVKFDKILTALKYALFGLRSLNGKSNQDFPWGWVLSCLLLILSVWGIAVLMRAYRESNRAKALPTAPPPVVRPWLWFAAIGVAIFLTSLWMSIPPPSKPCPPCGGTGAVKADCLVCNGTGKTGFIFKDKCNSCGGSGAINRPCWNCHGTGKIEH